MFEIEVRIVDGSSGYPTLIVLLAGELDISTAPELSTAIATSHDVFIRRLVVDLTQLSFMDSSGIGMLVAARRRAMSHGIDFALVCPNGPALRTLEIVGLDHVFDMTDTP